uniref:Uncharacterized protein n=1 Tax=Meloidogyne enterolobii TaxID=390850 RepID=A0A6V7UED5_MELEN|nr:unnamed protein product [Meloidogyne enterolobii]
MPRGLVYKNCYTRFTNNTFHKLGTITDKGKIVRFSLWTSNMGEYGRISFYNYAVVFLEIEFIGQEIRFFPYMSENETGDVGTDLFANSAEIDLTIRISNYYIWILFDNLLAKFITKLWPINGGKEIFGRI